MHFADSPPRGSASVLRSSERRCGGESAKGQDRQFSFSGWRMMREKLKLIALQASPDRLKDRPESCLARGRMDLSDMVKSCESGLNNLAAELIRRAWRAHTEHEKRKRNPNRRRSTSSATALGGAPRSVFQGTFMNRNLSMRSRSHRGGRQGEGRIAKERLKYLASCRTQSAVSELGFLGKKAAEEMVESCREKLFKMAAVAIQALGRGHAIRRGAMVAAGGAGEREGIGAATVAEEDRCLYGTLSDLHVDLEPSIEGPLVYL